MLFIERLNKFVTIRYILLTAPVFIQTTAKSQFVRETILENKIRMIETIHYGLANKYIVKNYYSIDGYDSAQFVQGVSFYTYTPQFDDKGRIVNLTKKDNDGKTDWTETFTYYGDSMYTSRTAEALGNTSYSLYRSNHDCIWCILNGRDTLFFIRNESGKIIRTDLSVKGKHIVETINEYDEKGYPLRLLSPGSGSTQTIYKTNDRGLITEVRQYTNEGKKEPELVYRYKYEYYK